MDLGEVPLLLGWDGKDTLDREEQDTRLGTKVLGQVEAKDTESYWTLFI